MFKFNVCKWTLKAKVIKVECFDKWILLTIDQKTKYINYK